MKPTKTPHVLAYFTWSTPALCRGVRAYARDAGWNLTLPSHPSGPPALRRDFDGVLTLMGDECAFAPGHIFPRAKIVDLRGTSKTATAQAFVVNDHAGIGRMAADYLHGLGCRRFAGLRFRPTRGRDEQLTGFENRVRQLGGDVTRLHADRGARKKPFGPDAMMATVRKAISGPGRPLGVFATDDFVADLFLQAALELGCDIPGKVAILGTNNDRGFCEMCRVPLSSIDTNLSRLGYEAALTLDRLMKGESVPRWTRIPPLAVEKRQSTELLALNDKVVSPVLEYIRDHFAEQITVEHIIRDCHIPRAVAYRRFRSLMGRSISEEIERVRLNNAKTLLAETNYKVEVVAHECGYLNTSSFCRRFRKSLGETPNGFRHRSASTAHP